MPRTNIQAAFSPHHRQLGAATVELAMLLTLLLLILAGIVEFGRALWYYDALAKATRDGARVMSLEPKATIQSAGITNATNTVINAANAAGISPALTAAKISITCLDASFNTATCVDGTAPANIRVAINGYTIDIGATVPFLFVSGGSSKFNGVPLAPHTVMRYML